jgi:hypothetical protein
MGGMPGRCVERLVAMTIGIMIVTACSVSEEYPRSWAALQPDAQCSIAGEYRNAGDRSGDFAPVSLEQLFLGGVLAGPESTSVQILQPNPAEITIRVKRNGEAVREKTLRRDLGFVCDETGVTLKTTSRAPESISGSSGQRRFTRAQDGSLIVREDLLEMGLLVLVPIPLVGKSRSWYRYQPYPSEANR